MKTSKNIRKNSKKKIRKTKKGGASSSEVVDLTQDKYEFAINDKNQNVLYLSNISGNTKNFHFILDKVRNKMDILNEISNIKVNHMNNNNFNALVDPLTANNAVAKVSNNINSENKIFMKCTYWNASNGLMMTSYYCNTPPQNN